VVSTLGNQGIKINLTKGKTRIKFDKILPMNKEFVMGVDLQLTSGDQGNAAVMLNKGKLVQLLRIYT
jgi:hypothetical protein